MARAVSYPLAQLPPSSRTIQTGPELAVCLLMGLAHHVCVPVDPQVSPQAALQEVRSCKARAVIIPAPLATSACDVSLWSLPKGVIEALLEMPDLMVFALEPDSSVCGAFEVRLMQKPPLFPPSSRPTPSFSQSSRPTPAPSNLSPPTQPTPSVTPSMSPSHPANPRAAVPAPSWGLLPCPSSDVPLKMSGSTKPWRPHCPAVAATGTQSPFQRHSILEHAVPLPPAPPPHPPGTSYPLQAAVSLPECEARQGWHKYQTGPMIAANQSSGVGAAVAVAAAPAAAPEAPAAPHASAARADARRMTIPTAAPQQPSWTTHPSLASAHGCLSAKASMLQASHSLPMMSRCLGPDPLHQQASADLAQSFALPNSSGSEAAGLPIHTCSPRHLAIQEKKQQQLQEQRFEASKFGLNGPSDACLLLSTSGTTGTRKVVHYTLEMLAVSAACVIVSWGLQPADAGLNMMPLWHSGGIIRNLLAPLLAGGAMCFAPAFNADLFWDLLALHPRINWYYASPTMHMLILGACGHGPQCSRHHLRLVCSAAAALPHALALELQQLFCNATVLPCYGMTECLPITCPPPGYSLERPGSCGIACGPNVAVNDPRSGRALPPGQSGHICVKGPPLCTAHRPTSALLPPGSSVPLPPGSNAGPSTNAMSNCTDPRAPVWVEFDGCEPDLRHNLGMEQPQLEPMPTDGAFNPGGWFDTGDIGYMDCDGYLFITGRCKETINSGGEVIGCAEIEEAVMQAMGKHQIAHVLAFAVPHTLMQEAVGVVLVMQPNKSSSLSAAVARPSLEELRSSLALVLPPSKRPAVLVYMPRLPCNTAGKPARVHLAQRLRLPAIVEGAPGAPTTYEAAWYGGYELETSLPIPCWPAKPEPLVNQLDSGRTASTHGGSKCGGCGSGSSSSSSSSNSSSSSSGGSGSSGSSSKNYHSGDGSKPCPGSLYLSTTSGRQVQKKLQELWRQVLGLPTPPHPDQDWSASGGSSLSMGRLVHGLRTTFGCSIPFATLFASRTIRAQASLICRALEASTVHPGIPAVPGLSPTAIQATAAWQPLLEGCMPDGRHCLAPSAASAPNSAHDQISDIMAGLSQTSNTLASPRLGVGGAGVPMLTGLSPEQLDASTSMLLCKLCKDNLQQADMLVKPRALEETQAQARKQQQQQQQQQQQKQEYHHRLQNLQAHGVQGGTWLLGRCVSILALVIQIAPLTLIHPLLYTIRRAAFLAGFTQMWPHWSQEPQAISLPLLPLLVSWILMWATSAVLLPLAGVAMKWILVWRFKPGRWPLWHWFYLRAWLVHQILSICGHGIWGTHPALLAFYYHLLGASIGSGTAIDPTAKLYNHDLLAIGDGCCIDGGVRLQPSAYETGHMTLQPISISAGCCIATGCCIAPSTYLSPGCCLPPMTSSHDVPYPYNNPGRHQYQVHVQQEMLQHAWDQNQKLSHVSGFGLSSMEGPVPEYAWGHQYRRYCRSAFPMPSIFFRFVVGWPLLLIVKMVLPSLPALAFIYLMLSSVKLKANSQLELWVASFMVPERLVYLFAAAASQRVLAPLIYLAGMIVVKRTVIGRFTESPRSPIKTDMHTSSTFGSQVCELGSHGTRALKGQYQPCRRSSSNTSSNQEFPVAQSSSGASSSGALSRTSSCSSLGGLHASSSTDCLISEIALSSQPGLKPALHGHPSTTAHHTQQGLTQELHGKSSSQVLAVAAATAVVQAARAWGAGLWSTAVASVQSLQMYVNEQWQLLRHWVMEQLVDGNQWRQACWLLGPHYELVSMVFRALGAKVGHCVYWPGTSLGGLSTFDLLEVGDDVVFGSRSSFMLCDAQQGRPICIESGAMVADRCVLLPGTHVGQNAMLGSGCTTLPGKMYAPGSVWVGSTGGEGVCLMPGDIEEAAKDTVKPFGRAVYQKQASYTLVPHWAWPFVNVLAETAITAFHLAPTLALVQALLWAQQHKHVSWRYSTILLAMWGGRSCMVPPLALFALLVVVLAKRLLVGKQRQPGRAPWDRSSYCQRWQALIAVNRILGRGFEGRGPLSFLGGSAYIVWAFRALGACIGQDVCLYPHGADPMMTEPDLVSIGDGACIDDAALVAHVNPRGVFEMNEINVGPGAVLRPGSRLMSGASMEAHARLLEGALCISGEVMEEGTTWKGSPAYPLSR